VRLWWAREELDSEQRLDWPSRVLIRHVLANWYVLLTSFNPAVYDSRPKGRIFHTTSTFVAAIFDRVTSCHIT
jgi:hypothetical protein